MNGNNILYPLYNESPPTHTRSRLHIATQQVPRTPPPHPRLLRSSYLKFARRIGFDVTGGSTPCCSHSVSSGNKLRMHLGSTTLRDSPQRQLCSVRIPPACQKRKVRGYELSKPEGSSSESDSSPTKRLRPTDLPS